MRRFRPGDRFRLGSNTGTILNYVGAQGGREVVRVRCDQRPAFWSGGFETLYFEDALELDIDPNTLEGRARAYIKKELS